MSSLNLVGGIVSFWGNIGVIYTCATKTTRTKTLTIKGVYKKLYKVNKKGTYVFESNEILFSFVI